MYTFELNITQVKCEIATNLNKVVEEGQFFYYSAEQMNEKSETILDIVKRNKGVGVVETEEYVEVYNDPYCSIPIFIYKGADCIYLTSVFEKLSQKDLSVDKVGVYETYLYESALHDRTLFNEIKQLPSASYVRIDKLNTTYQILPYWNFEICENSDIKTEKQAIDYVWNAMCNVFSKYKNKQLLMGISGGLDSRLSLCVVKEILGMDSIETFTFGTNKNILDSKLASEVLEMLKPGKQNTFFELKGDSYLEALDLPLKSGGAVGVNHSHIYWCLDQLDTSGKTLVSNYYSDAIMGYDCVDIEYADTLENCAYYKKLYSNDLGLGEEIVDEIVSDLRKIADRRTDRANFSCLDEFIYLVERNPKFHMRLSYVFQERIETVLPYAEYEMLATMISLPMEFRRRKRIEQLILDEKFVSMRDVSSTRYAGLDKDEEQIWKKLVLNIGYVKMKVINVINSGLNIVTGARIQIPNKYITENHLQILNRYFAKHKREACEYLYNKQIITLEQKEQWEKTCVRTAEAHRAFSLISVWLVLKAVDKA